METFRTFILSLAVPDGPDQDFKDDVKRDLDFPKSKEFKWSIYENYLIKNQACTSATEVAKRFWRGYAKLVHQIYPYRTEKIYEN